MGRKARLIYTSNGHKSSGTAGRIELIDTMKLSYMNNKILKGIIMKKITAWYGKFLRAKCLLLLRRWCQKVRLSIFREYAEQPKNHITKDTEHNTSEFP